MFWRSAQGRNSAADLASFAEAARTAAIAPPPSATGAASVTTPLVPWLNDLYAELKDDMSGQLASYIPELTRVDPRYFGIAIATVDGHVYAVGDSDQPFTIQSISKPFVYGLALDDHGIDHVMGKVGVEPTGEAFNSIVMDEVNNRPFNPMVNAGAIATTALVRGNDFAARMARIEDMFARYAGRRLAIDESVFASERTTGHRNRAIAYLQLNAGMIEEPVQEHLDLYFRQCSILVTARDLAMMAATLANTGVNPVTGQTALSARSVKSVLSVMASCGMYDYSGEWIYRIGLPAKSGVGGGIIAVLPGQIGVGIFSPLLNANGNSHRGIEACRRLSDRFRLHVYESHAAASGIVRRAYRGGVVTSKRRRLGVEQQALDAKGGAILVLELQGVLYFATAEQLLRRIADPASEALFIVLDGRRVSTVDTSALLLLGEMSRSLAAAGRTLVLAGFGTSIVDEWRSLLAAGDMPPPVFDSVDLALEHCEDRVIAMPPDGRPAMPALMALGDMDILRGIEPALVAKLAGIVETVTYAAGAPIIREGDAADRMFLLAAGSAAIRLKTGDGERSTRLAAFGPGVAFGELAFFDGGRRTADVTAETDATCYILTFAALKALETREPHLHAQILMALGRLLSDRLRRVNAEVRALA